MSGTESPDLDGIRLVLGALPDAAAVADRSGRLLATNARFDRELGGSGTSVTLDDLVDDPAAAAEGLALWFGSSGPRPASFVVEGRRYQADGARLGAHGLAFIRFRSHTDAVEAFAATSQAIDLDRLERTKVRLRNALAEVQASNAALRASNEELERFASIVSHDLQSPLLVIRGMAAMLLEQLEEPSDRELAEAVVRNAEKMQTQIRGILEVARAGTAGTPDEPLPLGEAVSEVQELLAGRLADGEVEFQVRGELPMVPLSRSEAVQLLQNLVQNALKFAADDGGGKVEISARRLDGTVEVTVADDGPGVPEEHREAVFDLFHRGEAGREGTGIGLATCRRIIERRGGRIWIDDSHLGGAAVRFVLPSAGRDEQAL